MKLFETIEKLQMLSKLIQDQRTGTPEQLAKRLGVSRSNLYNLIDDLKSNDIPISYSRSVQSFYFEKEIEFHLHFHFKIIEDNDCLREINGGYSNEFFPSNILDGRNLILPLYSNTKAILQALSCSLNFYF